MTRVEFPRYAGRILSFPTRSARACAVLAGVLAGGLTASTALHAPGHRAVVTAAAVVAPAPIDAEAAPDEPDEPDVALPPMGWEDRRNPVPEATRGAERSIPELGTMARPAAGAVTGVYGERRGREAHHPGIDFDGETGDPVAAAASGVVVVAGPAPAGYSGYGNVVVIEHGGGVATLYAHLSRVAVHPGQVVDAGSYLGAIGTSGHVTGSHLHFEVRIDGQHVNPTPWLAR